jgi:hypothetical protein
MADPTLITVLSIFSGNPDPELALPAAAVDELAGRLAGSVGQQQPATYVEPPGLGYRGFTVTNTGGVAGVPQVSSVYAGTITAADAQGQVQTWADTRQTEEFLLAQARDLGYGPILDQAGGDTGGRPSV